MFITHLSLYNFRNYPRLELDLPCRPIVLEGDNAQGKTNLLEAVYLLATARSFRASTERELIAWGGGDDLFPGARLVAQVNRADGQLQIEVILRAERVSLGQPTAEDYPALLSGAKKQVRLNSLPRRAADLVGQVKAVMFTAPDIDLVGGSPTLRRRYLDIALSQVDSHYLHRLQRYQRVLLHRNHLLRLLRQGQAKPEELAFWDGELVEHGSFIIQCRQEMVAALAPLAQSLHRDLTEGQEKLEITYQPSPGGAGQGMAKEPSALPQAFRRKLAEVREREIDQGLTLVGPHRDDLQFRINRVDMGTYGSRGQQRVIVLSLKLAEARFLWEGAGEPPILLLDDVLSELDRMRQRHLLEAIQDYPQVLITTISADAIPADFLASAVRFQVSQGSIHALESNQGHN